MKHVILIIYIISFTHNIKAQTSFGSDGTIWEHCYKPDINDPEITVTVESINDFIYENLNCSTLKIDFPGLYTQEAEICKEGNKVFYKVIDSLHIIYDFDLVGGDSLVVRYPKEYETIRPLDGIPSHFTYYIKSVETIEIGGQSLIRQYIECDYYDPLNSYKCVDNWQGSHGYITEQIGFSNWVFPYMTIFFEGDIFGGLNYFENAELVIENNLGCDPISSTININEEINVYPNPFTKILNVESDSNIGSLEVYDLSGKLLLKSQSTQIELAESGLYILKVIVESSSNYFKIINL